MYDGVIQCYETTLATCPNFQEFNPIMFDVTAFRAFLWGICAHKDSEYFCMVCLFHMYRAFDDFNIHISKMYRMTTLLFKVALVNMRTFLFH